MGLVTVLYVFVKVSLFLPQWVEVRLFVVVVSCGVLDVFYWEDFCLVMYVIYVSV